MCPLWSDKNQGKGRKFKSRCKQWSEIKIGKSRNTTLAWTKMIHITQKDYPPSNCYWFLQFFSLKYKVWWTGFLVCFKLEFYRLQQAEKSSSNWKKTWFIKLNISNWRIAKIKYGLNTFHTIWLEFSKYLLKDHIGAVVVIF